MDKIAVLGSGPLQGNVKASGAKNSSLPLIFSTLLAEGKHQLKNVPHLRDIDSAVLLMKSLGCEAQLVGNELILDVPNNLSTKADYELVRKMRASILVLGPLLAKCGQAEVSLPGGCAIGARPINFHLEALKKMGATIEVSNGYVVAKTPGLKGAEIEFPVVTVGGTENLMMAASLAQGESRLVNAAKEPEIKDLANMLRKMGAHIEGDGTSTILIRGSEKLTAVEHEVIPDRIEVGTLLVAVAMTGGEVTIENTNEAHLTSLLELLQKAGAKIEVSQDSISIVSRRGELRSVSIETQPYPGFPTDLQAQWMTLMTQCEGEAKIVESVFENRFMHVAELLRMNADIRIQGREATVVGARTLVGAPVMATDLRASASLVLAGMVAEGETLVQRIYHLDRGYENLELKLSQLGGRVRRIKN